MNEHKNDSQVWPEDLSQNNLPINGTADENADEPPRPVPRAGLGHPDAWLEYESSGDIPGESSTGDAPEAEETLTTSSLPPESYMPDIPEISTSDESKSGAALPDLTLPDAVEPDAVEPDVDEPDAGKRAGIDLPDPATVPELAPLAAVSGDGAGPPAKYSGVEDDDIAEPDPNAPTGSEQDLWSHLGELRARILYSVAAIMLASGLTWNYGQEISEWFARPIRSTLAAKGVDFKLVTLNPTEGFLVYFQITLVAAILISMPFTLFQMWRFLEPALTRTERRFSLILLPFSVILFFAGCGLGYAVSPLFFGFFLMFQPPGTDATFSYGNSIALLAKMILVFGLMFQVPIVTIFLNKIGVLSRNVLIDYWRHAFVVIFLICAVLTPTWDPFTLIVCAGPPCFLYGFSIWVMKWL